MDRPIKSIQWRIYVWNWLFWYYMGWNLLCQKYSKMCIFYNINSSKWWMTRLKLTLLQNLPSMVYDKRCLSVLFFFWKNGTQFLVANAWAYIFPFCLYPFSGIQRGGSRLLAPLQPSRRRFSPPPPRSDCGCCQQCPHAASPLWIPARDNENCWHQAEKMAVLTQLSALTGGSPRKTALQKLPINLQETAHTMRTF